MNRRMIFLRMNVAERNKLLAMLGNEIAQAANTGDLNGARLAMNMHTRLQKTVNAEAETFTS